MIDSADYKAAKLRRTGVYSKAERDSDYVPVNPSAEARICLNCPLPECKPDTCKRVREERKKLKEQQ